MIEETCTIEVDGCRLHGQVVLSEVKRPGPAVILCHGIPAAPYLPGDESYLDLCRVFAKSGYNTLIFRFRGTGESTGDFDFSGWARDLAGVIRWSIDRNYAVPGNLSIIGSSAGGAVATCVTADQPAVSRLVLLATPADMSALSKPAHGQPFLNHVRSLGLIRTPGFPKNSGPWFDSFNQMVPIKAINRVAPRPLLIVQGDQDDVVPYTQAQQLYDAASEPKELWMIKGAGHRLRHDRQLMQRVIKWLNDR